MANNINIHNYPYTSENNNKFLNLNGTFQTVNTENLTNITYSDLVTLVNLSNLTPGKQYRITDYVTTTTQQNTQAAGHQFDIIVTALNTNTLSENASAIQHEEDTYFAKSKLNAWQLKYSLENDKVKYGWADTANGKGVIWYMRDEWNNECGYDFKNIMFTRALTNGALDNRNGTDTSVYTFNGYLAGNQMDLSNGFDLAVAGGSGYITMCAENIIKSGYMYQNVVSVVQGNGLMMLNDNVFLCSANNLGEFNNLFVIGNVFEQSCYMNTLHGFVLKNVFGEYCIDNTFGPDCESNMFGDSCTENLFGENCHNNTFGDNCSRNTFRETCFYNTFGPNCSDNTFGANCESNMFGDSCSENTFGDYCIANTFGYNCWTNSFGEECGINTFMNSCRSNTFGDYCESNMFGDSCHHIIFGTGTTPINYVRYIQVENGVALVDITTTATTSNLAYLQNITISQGVNDGSFGQKTIAHPTVGDTFQTIYRPANSQIISV